MAISSAEQGSAAAHAAPQASRTFRHNVTAIVRVAAGNFLEMYDFMIFGYYAVPIAKTFFPSHNETASLMLSFATFGAGFLMRPLGAIVLGSYTDRHGRRAGLLLTLLLMSVGTTAIALTPGYARVGIFAPMLVLLGRLLQGFSAGVELGSVSIYLAEIAPQRYRGMFVSWQSASQQLAVVTASVLGLVLLQHLSPAEMSAWGWRVPFWIGCLLVPFLYRIRRSLDETEVFAHRKRSTPKEIVRSIGVNWRHIAYGILLTSLTTAAFYTITAYTPTFGAAVLHLPARSTVLVTICVGLTNFIVLPLSGALTDVIGRRRPLWISAVLMLLTSYPALLWLVTVPSFTRLLIVELWLAVLYSVYNGAMVVYLAEKMPPRIRVTSFSLAYSLATALIGGFTPLLATWLIHRTGNKAMPGAWLALCAILAITGIAGSMLVPSQEWGSEMGS